MTKEHFMDILEKDEFTVIYENGMPVVLVESRDDISPTIDNIKKYAGNDDIFDFSWGVRVREKIVTEYMKDHENPRILKTE